MEKNSCWPLKIISEDLRTKGEITVFPPLGRLNDVPIAHKIADLTIYAIKCTKCAQRLICQLF